MRFILAVIDGSLKLSNRRKADVEEELEAEGYDKLASQKKAAAAAAVSAGLGAYGVLCFAGRAGDALLARGVLLHQTRAERRHVPPNQPTAAPAGGARHGRGG